MRFRIAAAPGARRRKVRDFCDRNSGIFGSSDLSSWTGAPVGSTPESNGADAKRGICRLWARIAARILRRRKGRRELRRRDRTGAFPASPASSFTRRRTREQGQLSAGSRQTDRLPSPSLLQLARLLATSLKGARSRVPRALSEAMRIVPMNVAMRPYSTAVAPFSSLQKVFRRLVTRAIPGP